MENAEQEYAKLTNEPKKVVVETPSGVETVEVYEITMRHFKAFVETCSPFLKEFDEAGRLATRINPENGDRIEPEDFALFQVIADYSEAFVKAAALVTNKPAAFFIDLPPDRFFDVAAAIVEVNGNFFVKSLAPSLLKVGKALGSVGTIGSSY